MRNSHTKLQLHCKSCERCISIRSEFVNEFKREKKFFSSPLAIFYAVSIRVVVAIFHKFIMRKYGC